MGVLLGLSVLYAVFLATQNVEAASLEKNINNNEHTQDEASSRYLNGPYLMQDQIMPHELVNSYPAADMYPPQDIYSVANVPNAISTSYYSYPTNNSIRQHFTVVFEVILYTISLFIDTIGVIPASFGIGEYTGYSKLLIIRRDSVALQDAFFRLINIISTDLASVAAILSYIPGFSIVRLILSIPLYVIQKTLNLLRGITSGMRNDSFAAY